MTVHARNTDPETSHEAAASIPEDVQRASQQEVLSLLRRYGSMTDKHILEAHTMYGSNQYSDSRLRTARKELVDMGYVVADGYDTSGPRKMTVWAACSKSVQLDLFEGMAA